MTGLNDIEEKTEFNFTAHPPIPSSSTEVASTGYISIHLKPN